MTLADSATLDRDIAIRWTCASGAPGCTLRRARPAGPESASAFGLLTIAPPSMARTHMPRDLVLLLDVSGSMSGKFLDHLKAVVAALIEKLGDDDRLEIPAFGSGRRKEPEFRPDDGR